MTSGGKVCLIMTAVDCLQMLNVLFAV